MTDQNNARPGLTDEEIQDIADGFDIYGAKPEFARAIESALLSKLRAEGVQAGDERAMFERAYVSEFAFMPLWDDQLNGGKGAYATSQQRNAYRMWKAGRAALASAPVAGDERMRKALQTLVNIYVLNQGSDHEHITYYTPLPAFHLTSKQRAKSDTWKAWDEARAALASAPVAGEATRNALTFAAQVIELYDDATMRGDYMLSSTDCAGILLTLRGYFDAGNAAPQASEAVRNPSLIDLLIRAQAWMATVRGANRPNNLIRLIDDALKTQADKDD